DVTAGTQHEVGPETADEPPRLGDRGDEFAQGAETGQRALAGPSAHRHQFARQTVLRQPARFETVAGAGIKDGALRRLTEDFLAHRHGGKEMATGAAARDKHSHWGATLRDKASSAPSAVRAVMVEVPP